MERCHFNWEVLLFGSKRRTKLPTSLVLTGLLSEDMVTKFEVLLFDDVGARVLVEWND